MKRKITTIDRVQRFINKLYWNLEKTASMRMKFSKKSEYPEVERMNRLMDVFYKNKDLKITDPENITKYKTMAIDDVEIELITYIPNPDSKKWIIASHWFGGHKFWSLYHALVLSKAGYNILAYDFRNHGNSGKAPATMGATEHRDFIAALGWLRKEYTDIECLGIMGTSMGAYVTEYNNIVNGDILRSVGLKFCIADVPYGSMESLFWKVKHQYIKTLTRKTTEKRINKLINKINLSANVDLRDCNLFRKLKYENYIPAAPTLFLHGKYDRLTPVADSYELYILSEAVVKGNQIYTFINSPHTQSTRVHFQTQTRLMLEFVHKYDPKGFDIEEILQSYSITEPIPDNYGV
ncbi:alpha/beta hydrolase [Spiroplasma endosymbiont of Panorpa germanica]|uniref:alpha/beta hydrolase n=1 Tax=Spiroplasma endosymbiont of Panorpa germanica TaxID=3066314 RepID=UPI0030CD5F36